MYPGILDKLGVAKVPQRDDALPKKKPDLVQGSELHALLLQIVFGFIYVPQSYEH